MTNGGPKGRTVNAARAPAWWSEAWALFMKNPGMWLVFGVILLVGFVVLHFIPVFGGLVAALLLQVVVGGWMLSARKLASGGNLEPADLFLGFKDKLNSLVVLGAVAAGASIVLVLVMTVIGGGAALGMVAGGVAGSMGGMLAGAAFGMLALLIAVAFTFVMAMALWFAPALVVFHDVPPIDAMKASWSASLANIVAFIVYGLIWIAAAVVASIPLGLGWIALMPLTMLGIYVSYQDVFEGAPVAAAPE